MTREFRLDARDEVEIFGHRAKIVIDERRGADAEPHRRGSGTTALVPEPTREPWSLSS